MLLAGCGAPQEPPVPAAPMLFASGAAAPLPATLADCLRTLEQILPADLQVKMRSGREEDMVHYHFSVGRWLRNEWINGLEDKPLRRWFETNHQVRFSEDMSGIVLTSFWRHLNDRPLDVEGQVRELRLWYERHAPVAPPPTTVAPDAQRRD
jgi:hypothetical protein